MGNLYQQDVYLWSREQAAALRKAADVGSNLPVDWEHVAEEIESVGTSERGALRSHIRRVLEHLMKLQASAAADPRGGWIETVIDAQVSIEDVLRTSPSLRRQVADIVGEETPRVHKIVARRLARFNETPTLNLDSLSYTEEQVLGWCPDL